MTSAKRRVTGTEPEGAQKRRGDLSIRRFAVTYLLLMGLFFLVLVFKPLKDRIDVNDVYTKGIVIVTSKVLRIVGIPCTYEGSAIRMTGISLDVRFGCSGLEAVMIYSVAVIAFPSPWKKKLAGILAGFIAIQVINILRIAGLAYSGIHFRNLFEYIHIYVAQGMMIAVSLAIFFLYISYAKEKTVTA
ncbi:MAG TPA: exosortase H [Thermodesulfovibrionales bacterium]|nr:exosortase H [Thermodesulfovibrionales bacterium]